MACFPESGLEAADWLVGFGRLDNKNARPAAAPCQ
jgi:hypothetical protein